MKLDKSINFEHFIWSQIKNCKSVSYEGIYEQFLEIPHSQENDYISSDYWNAYLNRFSSTY